MLPQLLASGIFIYDIDFAHQSYFFIPLAGCYVLHDLYIHIIFCSQAAAYGQCVSVKELKSLNKGDCAKEFEKLKECFNVQMKNFKKIK